MASRPTRQKVNLRDLGVRRCASQKVGFSTYEDALQAAEKMMLAGKVDPGCHLTPYACEECPEWHVANRIIVWTGRR